MSVYAVTPQPKRWRGYWLWLNLLHTSAEMSQRFTFCDGVWYEILT